jgi:hypothetical protein
MKKKLQKPIISPPDMEVQKWKRIFPLFAWTPDPFGFLSAKKKVRAFCNFLCTMHFQLEYLPTIKKKSTIGVLLDQIQAFKKWLEFIPAYVWIPPHPRRLHSVHTNLTMATRMGFYCPWRISCLQDNTNGT